VSLVLCTKSSCKHLPKSALYSHFLCDFPYYSTSYNTFVPLVLCTKSSCRHSSKSARQSFSVTIFYTITHHIIRPRRWCRAQRRAVNICQSQRYIVIFDYYHCDFQYCSTSYYTFVSLVLCTKSRYKHSAQSAL